MFVKTLFCAQAVLGVKFTSTLSGEANGWDEELDFSAGTDKVITGVSSSHDNGREDRIWKFYTTEADGLTCSTGPLTGDRHPGFDSSADLTDFQNDWDGELDFTCPEDSALTMVNSQHDNGREDRRWRFRCCEITSGGKFSIQSVHTTGLLNSFDKDLDAKCNPNSVLVGLKSFHHNRQEDRRWAIKCGIVQEKANPIVVLPTPEKSDFLNDFDKKMEFTAPAGTAIVGLASGHANFQEDRRWKAYLSTIPTSTGVRCNPSDWTELQNDFNNLLDFTCPKNQAMVGFGGDHANRQEDRRFKFRCCDVGSNGFHISSSRTIGAVNELDEDMDFACAKNEVLVGLLSHFDSSKKDRIFTPKCGTLTKNAPEVAPEVTTPAAPAVTTAAPPAVTTAAAEVTTPAAEVTTAAAAATTAATDAADDDTPEACFESSSGDGADYRGCQRKSRSGKTCQPWTSQSPHAHSRTPVNYPRSGLGNHNYCRNPDGESAIWCYTTDPETRWEFCDPLAMPEYNLRKGATCADGYKPITTSWQDCEKAARSIGAKGQAVKFVQYNFRGWGTKRPQGCFRSTGNNRFHFNRGAGGNFVGNDRILCVRKGLSAAARRLEGDAEAMAPPQDQDYSEMIAMMDANQPMGA